MLVKPMVARARVVGSERLRPEKAVGMVSSCVGGGRGFDVEAEEEVEGRGSRGRVVEEDGLEEEEEGGRVVVVGSSSEDSSSSSSTTLLFLVACFEEARILSFSSEEAMTFLGEGATTTEDP